MYNPVQKGIDKKVKESVLYREVEPPKDLSHIVHRFWEIKAIEELSESFHFHR